MKLIPMGLLFPLLLLLQSCLGEQQHAEPEIFLVPAGFTGKVELIFDQVEGEAAKYEGEARLYHIGEDGRFTTQFKRNTGIRPPGTTRVFIAESGGRTELAFNPSDPRPDQLIAWGGYMVKGRFIFFVDLASHKDQYDHPAIDENR